MKKQVSENSMDAAVRTGLQMQIEYDFLCILATSLGVRALI
jgi:hypothetical protein